MADQFMADQETDGNTEGVNAPPPSKLKLNTGLKLVACLAFLALSLALWLMSGRSWLVFLLLLLPCYACEEWLSGKIFTEGSRWSTEETGFSLWRITYGVILVLLFFGIAIGLTLIVGWLF